MSVKQAAGPLRVLVVDDDDLMAEYMTIELEELGCHAEAVLDGSVALERLGKSEFDLLLTDWQMPGMDGMELARRARLRRSAESYLHVAMMTAREEASAISEALDAGVDDFLFKPIDPVQLRMAVASAERSRTLQRRLKRRNALLAVAHQRARDALQKVQADIDAAASLQLRLLPACGRHGAITLAHIWQPASGMGGDTFGAAPLDNGDWLFFLADVRGHGVPAALESFHLHHRLMGLRPDSPDRLTGAVARLNDELHDQPGDSYATLVCGLVSPAREQGWLIRAGHPPPILCQDNAVSLLDEQGTFPIGWFPDAAFAPLPFAFAPGSRLIVYSDGLTDCALASGEVLSTERLLAFAKHYCDSPAEALIENLRRNLAQASRAADQEDDISVLAIDFDPQDDGA